MKDKTAAWVFFANKDMLSAKALMNNAELTGEVAFHCQQAIEKFFKAYLTENGLQTRKIHDLMKLYSEVKEIKDWDIDEGLLEDISKIYTESRYPEDIGIKPGGLEPTMEDAKCFLDFAEKVEGVFKELTK